MGFIGDIIGGVGGLVGGIMGGMGASDAADSAQGYYDQAGVLTDAQARLANQQADQSAEQWDYWKQLYLPVQQQLSADQLGTYLPLQRSMAEQYRDVFMPFENQMFQEVQEGIKPDYEGVMGKASGDVAQGFAKTQEASNRGLMRYGIDPNSGRFAGVNRGLDIAESAMDAGSRTLARERETKRVDDTNWNRKAQLYGMKKGVSSGGMPTDFSGNAMGLSNSAMSGLGNAAQSNLGLGNQAYNIGQSSAYGMGSGIQSLSNSLGSLFGGSSSTGSGNFNYSSGLGSGLSLGSTNLGSFPGFAQGGPVPGQQPVIAGEEGPELYVSDTPPHRGGMMQRNEPMMREAVDSAFEQVMKTDRQQQQMQGGYDMMQQQGQQQSTGSPVSSAIEDAGDIYQQILQQTGDTATASEAAKSHLMQVASQAGPQAIGEALNELGPEWTQWIEGIVQGGVQSAQREPQAQVVGANGPQVFVPPKDGYIVPNPATQARMQLQAYSPY